MRSAPCYTAYMEPRNHERILGRITQHYQQVGSTNAVARAAAQAGEPEGLLITADEQTAGRGRRGHRWDAAPGTSLLLSLLLRPTWLPAEAAFTITMLAGVALCEAVEAVAPALTARLKWPNDLLVPTVADSTRPLRKAAGILCELNVKGDQIAYVILGIGINIDASPVGTVDGRDLALSATSLQAASGQAIERQQFCEQLLEQLDTHYTALRRGQREALFTAWRARLTSLGQEVTVTTNAEPITGFVEDVNHNGALVLRVPVGETLLVHAGDVSA